VLDRSAPPRRHVRGGDEVALTESGVIYRALGTKESFLMRIGRNETEPRKTLQTPILDILSVSPSGSWAIVTAPGSGELASPTMFVVNMERGTTQPVCAGCEVSWGPDAKWLYVSERSNAMGRTLALPLINEALPDSMDAIVQASAKGTLPPGAQVIGHAPIAPGPDPSTYAFTKRDIQRNLYRIPLH
jgi:hypothetical protein